MKTSSIFLATVLVLLTIRINAQVIPDSLRVDWHNAGCQGTIPEPSLVINVKDFGAYGDSVHDDYNAIINAINSSSLLRVIFFPAGSYLIKSPVKIPQNVILRGEGSRSNLRFDLSGYGTSTDCINISKSQSANYTGITSGYKKGSTTINVKDGSKLVVNGYAEIKENNGDWDPDKSGSYVGQMVRITGINSKVVSFTPALRIDYIDSLQPKIRAADLIENAGLECLKLTRLGTPSVNSSGKNIVFQYANNCWVTGVESEYCQGSHIALISSTHITISGCYIHDAYTYDGGGQAYGIFMHGHTSDSKVENSIFERLRHAMILASGANGNVYAYNYSTDPRSTTEVPPDNIGDLSLHGTYAFSNLFEGNIVQNIIVDDYWGAAGPYNTFFRNRAELYGIEILDQYNYKVKSDQQNLVGNEVTNTEPFKGNYYIQTSNHFAYDNNIRGIIKPPGTGSLSDSSYYLNATPYFWNIGSAWPSIGGANVLNSGTNPAKERYLSNESKTVCLKEPSANLKITFTADSIQCNGEASKILINATGGNKPYQGTGEYYKPAGNYIFTVSDAFGYKDSININLGEPAAITASINTASANTCINNGSINLSLIKGGKKPYQYSLDNNNFITDSSFKNLSPGIYNVWIKDSNKCIKQFDSITVAATQAFTLSAKVTAASSCKDDGSITMKRIGGTAPFKYSMNNKDYIAANAFYNLASDTYTVWAKDKTGCVDSLKNIIITRAAVLKNSIQKVNVSCKNGSDGMISIKASGATKPYLYSLDSINYSSNNVFSNLSAGTYNACVKDARGCVACMSSVIKNGKLNCPPVAVTFNKTNLYNHKFVVSIYPNPSTQNFFLTINTDSKEKIQFDVFDTFGRVIYSSKAAVGNSYSFGENFAPGVYTVKLLQNDNVKICKIIKQ